MDIIKHDYLYNIPIAVLYFLFSTKAVEVINNTEKLNGMCDGISSFIIHNDNTIPNPKYDECLMEKERMENDKDCIAFIMLMIIGIIGIVSTGLMKNKTPSLGIGFGSVLVLLYATLSYWNRMNDLTKLLITGLTLFILIAKSTF